MAKRIVDSNPELLEALRALGIEPKECRTVIIELRAGDVPIVHIQTYTDKGLLGVVKAIDGDLCVIREAPARDDETGGE